MSDKTYITFHVESPDGSEIKVKDVLHTDAPRIDEMFERFLDFLMSMSFTDEQISKKLKEYAEEY